MTSDAQIRAFIDRILRLKEEQDTIGEDIRDIYAEAKSMGFDKTAMGNVVAHLRKVAKKGHDTVAEQGAIFDLYLCAYEGKSPHAPAPARVRENIEQFDPTTGEIIEADVSAKLVETIATGVQTEVGRAALIAAVDIMIAREEAEEIQERPSTNDEASPEAGPQAEASPAGTGAGTLADREGRREGEAASVGLPTSSEFPSDERETDREAATPHAGATAGGEDVDRSAERADINAVASASGPDEKRAPLFAAKPPSTRRPHCLDRAGCGSYTEEHCARCKAAMQEREQAEEVA
ncbi:DUF2312 domain-containing protein [Sinorhizobium meliloti]|uniref:DUF2312 domain-containing protein n=1 Tax=Rhizobium meliloti TaxID=382 RepID=UPI0003147C29|nr:GapR family DNA-binding domain-containing protein [Sinorhizobium meliloti]MDE3771544.1 DUF2312 domain-containing protein [Sinorhizobium meliloti]MDE3790485.1 DUF2312 domain-containing protein [Sinorhizobium meliloti]MDW9709816.1 DUF2312 domain-containing protein [Sinorhizobium meliloti]MDW9748115.1 DUF2312 domain-containing protein [Sinorhizobium meliloti]MDW9803446.1 DUF2312 domain-containing protein [Sinorhizobium meliloti]